MKSGQLLTQDSGDVEMYTPPEIIEAARRTMGGIDLDPASSLIANQRVKADYIFTKDNDGLAQQWLGNIWMNHPFSKGEKACRPKQGRKKMCKKKNCIPKYKQGQLITRGHCITQDIPSNSHWIDHLLAQYRENNLNQSCNITFGSTSESWYQKLAVFPQCVLDGRTQYYKPNGEIAKGVTKGSVVTYLGNDLEAFAREFSPLGRIQIDYEMVLKLIKGKA